MSLTKAGASIVVFSDVDGVLRAPHRSAFAEAAATLKELVIDATALVLCSGKTRAELEWVQQKLEMTQPFICENGGGVIIPNGYFKSDVPNARNITGCQAVEFGKPYTEVVDTLHRTADRLRIEIVGFSDMSIEDVAKACKLPLLQARLAKLREYEELFRLTDPSAMARSRLFKALDAAGLRPRAGGRFDRVGASGDGRAGVKLLTGLYRLSRGDLITVGVAHPAPGDNLLRLVDHAVIDQSIDVVDWAAAIVDRVKGLRSFVSQNTVSRG